MLVRLQDSCGNWITVNLAVGVTADDIGLGNVQSDLEYLTTRKAKMSNATPDSHGQVIGNVCLSSDFTINSDGEISLSGSGYELPIASTTTLGGIKLSDNFSADSSGVLSIIKTPASTINGQLPAANLPSTVIVKDDIAVVSGQVTLSGGTADVTVNYPTGFSVNNCVPIAFGCDNTSSSAVSYTYGYGSGSMAYTMGGIERQSQLKDDGIRLYFGAPTTSSTITINYKLILMKIV